MYSVKEIHHFTQNLTLPNCMYGVKNIHKLPVHEQLIEVKSKTEAATLEERQDNILRQLELLKQQLGLIKSKEGSKTDDERISQREESNETLTRDIVINANPNHPPFSLLIALRLMKKREPVGCACFVHSSLTSLPIDAKNFLQSSRSRHAANYFITLIWKKDVQIDPVMIVNPVTQVAIEGEVNILRYLSNLVEITPNLLQVHRLTEIDAILDAIHGSLTHGTREERQSTIRHFDARLGKSSWLAGASPTIADLAAWSALKQCRLIDGRFTNLKNWICSVNALS